jgi:uncharacterized protein (TIGR03435 family)
LSGILESAYVADKTALPGTYDFHLLASWELPRGPNPSENPDNVGRPLVRNPGAPSVFTALQEQLALKLERQRVAVEFLYVDHAERPSGN